MTEGELLTSATIMLLKVDKRPVKLYRPTGSSPNMKPADDRGLNDVYMTSVCTQQGAYNNKSVKVHLESV
jgi:hypothetical protein